MLFSISALAIIIPVAVFHILSNQNAFLASITASSGDLASNAGAQKLVSQLGGPAGYSGFSVLANAVSSAGYVITPYNAHFEYTQQHSVSRFVVFGGNIYYLKV